MLKFFIFYVVLCVAFLCWWMWWRNKRKTIAHKDETLILLFLVRDRGTNFRHSVFFSEACGIICPTLGNTHGRYENLTYMCPDYEFEPEAVLIYPTSFKVKALHESVGTWIDNYWKHKFNKE